MAAICEVDGAAAFETAGRLTFQPRGDARHLRCHTLPRLGGQRVALGCPALGNVDGSDPVRRGNLGTETLVALQSADIGGKQTAPCRPAGTAVGEDTSGHRGEVRSFRSVRTRPRL